MKRAIVLGGLAWFLALWASDRAFAGPGDAAGDPEFESGLRQAREYLSLGRYQNAIGVLDPISRTEEGSRDPRVWLVLGRAHFRKGDLDCAGWAIDRARALGTPPADFDEPWAPLTLSLFTEVAGSVVIRSEQNRPVLLKWKPLSPILGDRKRKLRTMVLGEGEADASILRRTNLKFYLPSGRHALGGLVVEVRAGETIEVKVADMPDLEPGTWPPVPGTEGHLAACPEAAGGRVDARVEPPPSWLERNIWEVGLIGGGVLVAAGVVLATCCSGSDTWVITEFTRP